jgi:hypothetical protein
MGTASGTTLPVPETTGNKSHFHLVTNRIFNCVQSGSAELRAVSQFGEWFTWCQSCRHGGHASHLLHWFSIHTDCPVTGCTCKCAQLDADSEIGM